MRNLILYVFCLSTLSLNAQESVTDFDGNVYNTVKIGNQVWTTENLKVTHFRNGDEIPVLEDCNSTSPRLVLFEKAKYYGAFYNFYAISDPRDIAPEGWHVPTIEEWQELINYLGGEEMAGLKLKEEGTSHWKSPNLGSTNESGFTALPYGRLDYPSGCGYTGEGKYAYFFTSSGKKFMFAYALQLGFKTAKVTIWPSMGKKDLCPVRLIKD